MTALVPALVSVAKASNLVGAVFADGKASLSDVGLIIGGLGDLSGIASIDFAGVLDEAGKLKDADKAAGVVAFKTAFDLPDNTTEAAIELAVDAALGVLVSFDKTKQAIALLKA